MANPAPTINQINAFNATQGTTIDFNIIGGTELVRSNRIYIYDLSDNSLICTHLYASTESIHELPPNTDGSIVYESGKSSADFVNGAQYYAQIQTFTDVAGTEGGSGLSIAKMFWCLVDPTLTITTIPSTISTTSYNVSATYNANTSVVSNIIQQYQFSLYSATGSLLQSSGVVVGNGEQQGTSTAYDISYNFSGLSVGSSYYVAVDVTTTQGMSVSAQSGTFTVSIDTPTLGEATVVNNACDGYISVTSNLSGEYGGSGSGETVSFETDSENVFTKLQVTLSPTQSGSGTPSPSNVRPIYGVGGVDVLVRGFNLWDEQWENGGINTSGNPYADSSIIRSKNFIPIAPNTAYCYMKSLQNDNVAIGMFVHYYDENYTFISRETTIYTNWGDANFVKTSPNNARYIKFFMSATYGNTYNNDICINVSDTELNGTYQPYTEQTISQDFNVSLTPTSKDTDPYLFKAVGDIYGDRLEDVIVGGSVVRNQLVQNGDFSSGQTGWVPANATGTLENGYFHITNGTNSYPQAIKRNVPHTLNHVELTCITVAGDVSNTPIGINNNAGANAMLGNIGTSATTLYVVSKSTVDTTKGCAILSNTQTAQFKVYSVAVVDLTAMFGSTIADYVYSLEQATAGSGIAWLKSYGFLTKPYYEYDTGTLKSVTPTAHVTRGVNAWDEEWEVGAYSSVNGSKVSASNRIRCKNQIPVIAGATYYFKSSSALSVYGYDIDGVFVAQLSTVQNTAQRIPNNVHNITFNAGPNSGETYANDICINISDPTINGKYFPYEEHTYDLGNVPLYGLFQLVDNKLKAYGDVRHAVGGTDRKFRLVDLGALIWDLSSDGYFRADVSGAKIPVDLNHAPSMICKYPSVAAYDLVYNTDGKFDKTSSISSSTGKLLIRDSAYSTAAAFKTAMNGVMLVCEKATPTTETTAPFTQIQEVSKYGTLEYITNNGIPVGHNTTYLTRDVFGGTLDLVSGQLVVDRKYVLGDTLDWAYVSSGTYFYAVVSDKAKGYNNVTCNIYATAQQAGVANLQNNQIVGGMNDTAVYVKDSRYTNATTFKQAMSETGILYELATPLTYQLTPQQIQTLIGQNNVWSEQGDIELSYHIPITNLLVKRQDVDDVSGNWLTLYSQPVEQASDMDFTFIDFLNQYGKTYKYALVPLLTQTQSGVEVEVEGGYTVSDEVQSIFDGVFISDSTGSQKCKANVGYGNVNMNQSVGSITPIGSQYPIIVTNSNNRYHNGSISGMIVPDDYYYNGNLSRIDMVNKRNELEQFLTNKRAKIIKDWNSNIWLVMIMDNIDCSFDNNYGMGIVTFNANWLEVGDPTNQEDLQATGLVDVGGV